MSPQADRAPAFQFYPRDWETDSNVIPMNYEEEGVYFALCRRYWLDGTLSSDLDRLRRILKGRPSLAKMQRWWDAIAPCFQVDGNCLRHKRLDRERENQIAFREAKARAGAIGGRARPAQAKAKQTEAVLDSASSKTEANGSSSSSSSSSSASSSASSPAKSESAHTRTGGAMGGSYLSQSNVAYQHRGHMIPRGAQYAAFVERFDGDAAAFKAWLDAEIDAAYEDGQRPGQIFKFVDERYEKRGATRPKQTTENAANLTAFVARMEGRR